MAAYFLRLGASGFGGPIALAGRMHRDLVVDRGWVDEHEYREGFALAQLAPGPLAAQLAIYLGWVRFGAYGATLVGICFVVPSFIIVVSLAWLYVRSGGTEWIQHVFYGAGAAVIAIIARSVVKLARGALSGDRLLWTVFLINGVATAISGAEWITLIAASGAVVLMARASGRGFVRLPAMFVPWVMFPVAASSGVAGPPTLGGLFWFFTKAGLVVFGSGLAIVPFLYGGVVERYDWLTERQFLDAVAVSVLTPGPVVITVAFIGYLVSGFPGALAAAAGVFLPTYLVVVLVARRFHRFVHNAGARAFVDGVTAAAIGALAGAVIVLGRRTIVDLETAVMGLASMALLLAWPRLREPIVLLAAGAIGVAIGMRQ